MRCRQHPAAVFGLDELCSRHTHSDRIDRVVLHPVAGPAPARGAPVPGVPGSVCLGRTADETAIEGRYRLSGAVGRRPALPDRLRCRSLLVDGIIAGAGGVLVFLPQILILFFFILLLEESGYLPRAAFLLDRLMGSVGLSGTLLHPPPVELRLRDSRHHGRAHHLRTHATAWSPS